MGEVHCFTDWPEQGPRIRVAREVTLHLHEGGEDHAFYHDPGMFGFAQGVEVSVLRNRHFPEMMIVEEKRLSGNAWGQTPEGKPRTPDDPFSLHWLVIGRDHWTSVDRMLASWRGETEVPPRCRKPRRIEPMTAAEIADHLDRLRAMYVAAGIPVPEAEPTGGDDGDAGDLCPR